MLINSSVLPVGEGALESSNGLAKGPPCLTLSDSELQLERREELERGDATGDATGDSTSRYRGRERVF